MELNLNLSPNSTFSVDKITEMLNHHANFVRLKEEVFAAIIKATDGKLNTTDMESARDWLGFILENPKSVTSTKYKVPDFVLKMDAHVVLAVIEKIEGKDQAYSKVLRNTIASDARFYWSTAEDFYIEDAKNDPVLKAKYKDLQSISPKRQTESQMEKDLQKLQTKLTKKNGESATQPAV